LVVVYLYDKANPAIGATKENMAELNLQSIIDLAPQLAGIPFRTIWSSSDAEADVLYLNFKKPSHADDTELTDDDILIRYEKGEVVGVTVLHASQRRTVTGRRPERPPQATGLPHTWCESICFL
jgi:uncharacterized protein YuzE